MLLFTQWLSIVRANKAPYQLTLTRTSCFVQRERVSGASIVVYHTSIFAAELVRASLADHTSRFSDL